MSTDYGGHGSDEATRVFGIRVDRFERLHETVTSDYKAAFGLTVVVAFVLAAIFAPELAPYDPMAQEYAIMQSPSLSSAHPLGTDSFGRDLLSRMMHGARISLAVGLAAVAIAAVVGVGLGLAAGYYGGWIDDALMRGVEVLYAIPFLILVLALLAVLQARDSLLVVTATVGVVNVPEFARLIRSRVLAVREATYVEAARAAGRSHLGVVWHHVVPNSLGPVVVQGTVRVGTAILVVAALSFLGFGVSEPTPSWGAMLATARDVMLQNLWFSLWPGLAILVTVVGFTLLGDGLRDALDPRDPQ